MYVLYSFSPRSFCGDYTFWISTIVCNLDNTIRGRREKSGGTLTQLKCLNFCFCIPLHNHIGTMESLLTTSNFFQTTSYD
jgi:hypothetical protein